jgi:pyruvate dehydrogenase E2 component (dihydrolipoamide acetyltransferase)
MSIFKMPSLGADMEAGKLVEWLVKPGDKVTKGDVIAVVETHKGAIEIEVFEGGVVESLEVELGETVPVGTPMAGIRSAADQPQLTKTPISTAQPAKPVAQKAAPRARQQDSHRPASDHSDKTTTSDHSPMASPAARMRAAEAGLALTDINGTGPCGAILLTDVETRLARHPQVSTPEVASEYTPATSRPSAQKPGLDMGAMRQAIAVAMSRSKREIPHYYLSRTIDLQPAVNWLSEINNCRIPEQRLLMGALFVKATALAAATIPELNGHFEEGVFTASTAVHAGLAVAMRGGGLIAPALRDAAVQPLDGLMVAIRDVVARTRSGRLRNSEITDGTITISSMGEGGADTLYGVIYPPQVALVGFGTPVQRPWLMEGEVCARTVVTVTVSADHRVSNGRHGAQLLAEIERYLMEPDKL